MGVVGEVGAYSGKREYLDGTENFVSALAWVDRAWEEPQCRRMGGSLAVGLQFSRTNYLLPLSGPYQRILCSSFFVPTTEYRWTFLEFVLSGS